MRSRHAALPPAEGSPKYGQEIREIRELERMVTDSRVLEGSLLSLSSHVLGQDKVGTNPKP